ncbi:MAG: DsbA family protein [Gammaproteobacteria bacterium]|nr:DsbA family protein [Gammaproteobacteria bacterium]
MVQKRSNSWSDYFLWILLACACVVTGLVVRHEIDTRIGWPIGTAPQAQGFVEEWREIAEIGHIAGSGDASVTIILFIDFQCSYCRAFSRVVPEVTEEYGGDVATVFRHYPLPIHPEAANAAVASECAGQQGSFWEYHDILLEDQHTIGSRSWSTFAIAASVRDLDQFEQCISTDSARVAVRRDLAAGADLGITGTPTFLINGSLYRGAMSKSSLRSAIDWHMRRLPNGREDMP